MDFDVLPGPSLPERARTALARAAAATVSDASLPGAPPAAGQVPVRATRDGNALLLPPAGSLVAAWLAARPQAVRVSLPAGPPFSALRLTRTAVRATDAGGAGQSAQLAGSWCGCGPRTRTLRVDCATACAPPSATTSC